MHRATRADFEVADVIGVRFHTDVRKDSEGDLELRKIQYELSDGDDTVGYDDPIPHLAYYGVDAVDGTKATCIILWVPKEMEQRAIRLLEAADIEVG